MKLALVGLGVLACASALADVSAEAPPAGIARRELLVFLDGKPGAFLQHVQPEARFQGGRFYGWRLAAFFPGDARFAGVDVRAGDIVLRVNGSSLERPEQFFRIWDSLRVAKELVVEIDRGGAGKRLRWAIRD
jgi:type II secretory pathway component PulC